jgi:hypothetical protein
MLNLAFGLLLVVEPPDASEASAEPSDVATEDVPVNFASDMPDPYAPDWEPPEGPKPPPPAPPPPPSLASSSELPPNGSSTGAAGISNSPEAAVHGQRLQLAGIVFGVSGAVGLAVGVYLYDDVSKRKNELAAEQAFVDAGGGSPGRVEDLQNQLEKRQLGMTISLIAGGSSLGLGAILFGVGTAVKKRSTSAAITWLSPGPGLVGLAIKGRF